MTNIVIAIDGPAASGKSSTAQWVARKLGYYHVDSGSLYRAATALQLDSSSNPEAWTDNTVLSGVARIDFVPARELGTFVATIDGIASDDRLRGIEVTRNVSRVAKMQAVREWVNGHVRRTAEARNVVVDGRDIGTAVFPEAPLKIFLIADPWERARRRLIQRLDRHPNDREIAEETELIVKRDARDATQTVQASDAVLIDTTYLTQEEQVDRIVALARAVTQRPHRTSGIDG
ncbi:MAG TPA: (d)CMP kinase [Gemmatimonadaceae bacterium]